METMVAHAAISGTGPVVFSVSRAGEIGPELLREWQDLSDRAAFPNPFFAPWFLHSALNHLDPMQEVSLLLGRCGATNRLDALLPVVFEKGYAKLPLRRASVWVHKHCYSGAPLIRRGREVPAFSGLIDWIDTRPTGAAFLRFESLPLDPGLKQALENACSAQGRSFLIQTLHERAVLRSGTTVEAVMARAMTGKKRKELRRQSRRFDELGAASLGVERIETPERARAVAEAFLTLESGGWKGTKNHGEPLAASLSEARFFRRILQDGAKAGAVECVCLELDAKPVAMLIVLGAGPHRAAFKTAYDEGFAAYSPGVRILVEITRACLEDETATMLDSCARAGHPVVDGLWPDRLPVAKINVAAGGAGARLLLGTAATIEKLKIGALRRLNRPEA